MPLELLRAFTTVAERRGVTRASKALGLSQPAVSLQLKRLETLIGAALFQRRGQGFDLTQPGRELLPYAERMLGLNDEALARLTAPTVRGHLRLGIPSEFAIALLPKVIGRFAKRHPSVTLEVITDLSRRLVERFGRQSLDVILALHDAPDERCGQPLGTDELVWVSSQRARQGGQGPVPLVLAPEGCVYRRRIIQAMERARRRYAIVYTALDLSSIEAAIAENLGISALARRTAPNSLKVLNAPRGLPELGSIAISVMARAETDGEAQRRLVEYVCASL